MFKWLMAGAIVGAGMVVSELVYTQFVNPRLPADWRLAAASETNLKPVYARALGVGLGTVAVIPLALKIVGMGAKSPIKPEVAPLK